MPLSEVVPVRGSPESIEPSLNTADGPLESVRPVLGSDRRPGNVGDHRNSVTRIVVSDENAAGLAIRGLLASPPNAAYGASVEDDGIPGIR